MGVGVSGVVVQDPDAVVYAQTLGWDGVPLERMIRAEVGIPLHIDNGAKTQGQAEMWFGAGRGARHAVFALVGSGVGATVVSDGATYRGVASSAGEWGHTTLAYGGRPCRCGARGCLEAYVGAEAIIERYREARRGRAVPGADEESQINALLAAADRSETARRVLDETAGYLGAGVANLINLFNPNAWCWVAGPGWRWARGSCPRSGRRPPRRLCASRSSRRGSSWASWAWTRWRWAPRRSRSPSSCPRAASAPAPSSRRPPSDSGLLLIREFVDGHTADTPTNSLINSGRLPRRRATSGNRDK
ncbi:hypothetical protein Pflav_034880 [Phytohabitans flavus]|uniref:Glucokinase n=1 Tax=Phytohabitans flavus TaxID=1076124 RepID=A0A6F8XTL1_9ACTN|nr:ROK family protein [Phytohabitans flavus]BCB77078.1 hypothetical protein Pflav_034880 [Phytohabitans flavus]